MVVSLTRSNFAQSIDSNDPFCKTYDFRGKYGSEVTEEKCFRLGLAASAFKRPIVLGMDYREHNDALASAFLQGFAGESRFAGIVPSPVIGFHAKAWGVQFTASHNPAGDNGVKFKKHQRCFFGRELETLRNWYFSSKKPFVFENNSLPKVDVSLVDRYVLSLPEIRGGLFDLCGGAACALKDSFENRLFDVPDPVYQHHGAEPKDETLSALKTETKTRDVVGFAFDGDADRCVAVDGGVVVDGSILAAFIAQQLLPNRAKVLVTIDTPAEIFSFLENAGFSVSYTPVGDVYLIEEMLKRGADFAAERSGHYSFKKHMPDSDGLYAAALLSGTKPGVLLSFVAQFKNVSLKDEVYFGVDFEKLKVLAEEKAVRVDAMDGVKAQLEDFTFLVRASQTESKVRMNVEAVSTQKAREGLVYVRDLLSRCHV